MAAVQMDSGELLVGYYDAIHQQTTRYVERLGDADLARIVDRSGAWVGGEPRPAASAQRRSRRPPVRKTCSAPAASAR